MGQLGTSLQYLEDLHSGKERADTTEEFLTGLATGHSRKG
jgi:hypothetical protein